MKKALSLILALTFVLTCFPLSIISVNAAQNALFEVESVYATAASTVDVEITVENNPGIAGAMFTLTYDSGLTLLNADNSGVFSDLTFTKPGSFVSPCNLSWDSEGEVATDNGTVIILTFEVADTVAPNEKLNIGLSYRYNDIYDRNLNSLTADIKNGSVTIINYIPGDVNGDNTINGKDVTLIRRFIAGGYDVEINEAAADVNDDGIINGKDVTIIRRYIADGCQTDPDGYNVKLVPSSKRCNHTFEAIEAKEATCTDNGNIAYWHCTTCERYFADASGNQEIAFADTVISAKGHTVVIDEAVPATYTEKGLSEGSHCSVCGEVFVAQEEYGPLEQDHYSIEYFIYGNDEYLAGIVIDNSSNPTSFTSESGVAWLEDLVVPGYTFEGWFDGQGSAASRVTSIPVGTARNIKLFAKWTKEVYTITFDNSSMNLPRSTMNYTVDQRVTLDKPTVDRYVFLGWTTDKDELVSEIKPGTTGNFTLHSNWTSKRNLAKPVASLGSPIIVEDTIEGKILFTYEIGQVENVPLYTIKNLPSAGGVVSVYTETVTKSISTTDASTVAKAIDHITTDSTSWTLSEDWNETTHVEDSVLEEHGYDRTTGQSVGKTSSNTFTLTTSEYDNTVVKANDGTVATTTQYNTNEVDSRATWESKASLSVSDTESVKYTDSAKVSAEVGVGYGPVSAKVGASAETSTEISSSATAGASAETTIAHENTSHSKTGTDTVTVADNTTTTTTDKGWNKSSSSASTSSSSLTKYEEETLSEKIATEKKYGQSYAKGGSNSTSADWSTSTGESNLYSSTFTYFNSEETTEGVSYTINGESDGSYRLVRAGVVHVFAVVIYDIANAQYSVTTYSVLDDDTYTYIDYSATSAAKFDDNENGVLPFEVPYFVNDYVNGRIVATEGLKYNEATLSTGEYEGSNTSVIIPEFFAVDNQDNTNSAYTVRYLSADTFSGNTELKSVMLSNYIREIPDNAFMGCTSLQFVYGSEICSIGNNAFDGCVSLGQFKIPSTIEFIGENAFRGVDSIVVTASSKDVVFGAIKSGAKRITINISAIAEEMSNVTMEIPNTVEYFELQGGRNTFSGLKIKSNAGNTVLNGITITNSSGIPMEISSESVTLNQVIVESPSYVLLLKGNAPTVLLYGTSKFISSSDNSVVCRNVTFDKISSNVSSKLEITGNLLAYGAPNNASFISFSERGEIVLLTADEYEKYIKGSYNVSFDANEGTVDISNMVAYVGSPIGTLPIPTRDYYTFVGWYLQDGTTKITDASAFSTGDNITLYAHWSHNPISDWVLPSQVPAGATIENHSWSYREYTSSSSSSKSGWVYYDNKRTDWGSWSDWLTSNPDNGVRNVEYRYQYIKTQYHYYRWTNGYGMYTYKYNSSYWLEETWFDYQLPVVSGYSDICYNGSSGSTSNWWAKASYSGNYSTDKTFTRDVYQDQWRYQDPIYTYYFYRDIDKSASYPYGLEVSGVIEWVKYRAK